MRFDRDPTARPRPRSRAADDRELLEALRRDGDRRAFDALMERKTAPLLAAVRRMVGDREEARDIVQLTFLRVWENREKYDSRYSPNTWLYRIATNLAIDFLRSRSSRDRGTEPVRRHLYRVVEGRRRVDLANLERREVERILRQLAAGLTERQRMAFLLREVEELSTREVAEILGCRESTVRNHLFTARGHLRRELARRYPEYVRGLAPEGEEPR